MVVLGSEMFFNASQGVAANAAAMTRERGPNIEESSFRYTSDCRGIHHRVTEYTE
jgi:hypothetical protein